MSAFYPVIMRLSDGAVWLNPKGSVTREHAAADGAAPGEEYRVLTAEGDHYHLGIEEGPEEKRSNYTAKLKNQLPEGHTDAHLEAYDLTPPLGYRVPYIGDKVFVKASRQAQLQSVREQDDEFVGFITGVHEDERIDAVCLNSGGGPAAFRVLGAVPAAGGADDDFWRFVEE